MRRFRVPEVLLGVLLAAAIFGLGYSISSAARQPSPDTNADQQQGVDQFVEPFLSLWDWLTYDAITVFTLFLTGSTVLLWVETRRSVKAVVAADLPRLRLSKLLFGRAHSADPRDNTKFATVTIGFTNYGGRDALVTEVCFEQRFAAEVPDQPTYGGRREYASFPIVIPPGKEHTFPPEMVIDDGNKQLAAVLDMPSGLRFWVYGYVGYEDHLGKPHRIGFIGDWNHLGQGIGQFPSAAMQRGETFHIWRRKNYTYNT